MLLFKDSQISQSPAAPSILAKIESILNAITSEVQSLTSKNHEASFSLHFIHHSYSQIKLKVFWTFTVQQQMEILIQMSEGQFGESQQGVATKEILLRMNRENNLGDYFTHASKPHLLCFKMRISLQVVGRYLKSIITQIFKQTGPNFLNFAMRLRLFGEFNLSARNSAYINLINLGKLKERLQFERQSRQRATKYYNLSNSTLKIIDDARIIIGCNFALLRNHRSEAKVDKRRKEDCQSAFQQSFKRLTQVQPQASQHPYPILSAIEVKSTIKEEKLDESRYSIIYRGCYEVKMQFTVNPYTFTTQELKQNEKEETKMQLVRKVALENVGEEKGLLNQIDFLKRMRFQRSNRIGEYFLALSEGRVMDSSIYSRFYPKTLADCVGDWGHLRLLRTALQTAEGILFLSDRRVLHRDLKEWNVLIDQSEQARLIDFGSTSGVIGSSGADLPCRDKLMSTVGYYYPYSDLRVNCQSVAKLYTRNQYYQWPTFDVYSFGTILNHLFELDSAPDSILFRELDYLSRKCKEINPQDRPRAQQVAIYLHELIFLYISENRILAKPLHHRDP